MKNNMTLFLQEVNDIVDSKGGKFFPIQYIYGMNKIQFRCIYGHEWWEVPEKIIYGKWCPICKSKSKTRIHKKINQIIQIGLEELQQIAIAKGGKCLSDKYINNYTKLKFQCKEGHIWSVTPKSIKSLGSWCPICANKSRSLKHINLSGLKQVQKIAILKGGKCISKRYINCKTKLLFECNKGHRWQSTPSCIKRGKWCPYCNIYRSEEICRMIFELAFKTKFPRLRPIPNPNNIRRPLELDGYNKELKIAFEYNGIQHYKDEIFIGKPLKKQLQRDQLKIDYCKNNSIILIIIPYTIKSSIKDLYQFIREEYIKLNNIQFPVIDICKININSIYNHQIKYRTILNLIS